MPVIGKSLFVAPGTPQKPLRKLDESKQTGHTIEHFGPPRDFLPPSRDTILEGNQKWNGSKYIVQQPAQSVIHQAAFWHLLVLLDPFVQIIAATSMYLARLRFVVLQHT